MEDDDCDFGNLLWITLSPAEYTVETAENGVDGIEKARAIKLVLVIMDLQMPRMTGFEAIRALKGNDAVNTMSILVLSMASASGDNDDAYSSGSESYINKPVEPAAVIEQVKNMCPP